MKIAVSGKGGVGKTTISALLMNIFASQGHSVIAINADPDANLAFALGFPVGTEIIPLIDLKDLIRERVGAAPGQPTVYFKMNPRVDDIPERFSVKKDNLKLMAMGTIRRGGNGCACPENVLVKQLLSHLLLQSNEIVIMDMEAGIEHLGRGTSQFVNLLLVVVEPTTLSLQTCSRIKKLAADLKIPRVAVVANKIRTEAEKERILKSTDNDVWCWIPYAQSLVEYNGREVEENVGAQINALKQKLMQELSHGN